MAHLYSSTSEASSFLFSVDSLLYHELVLTENKLLSSHHHVFLFLWSC